MIDQQEIASLAEFYDAYANALNIDSPERETAKRQFHARLSLFYEQEVKGIEFDAFRLEMIRHCKEYLRAYPKTQKEQLYPI
jgi:hypothetical protein